MTGAPVDDPAFRVARLNEAKKKFKRGQTCNMVELAAAAGVTDRRMSQEVKSDRDFPVIKIGHQGVDYLFDAKRACDYLIKKANAKLAERREKSELLAQLSGIQIDPALMPQTLSIAELSKIADMQQQAHRRKVEQREYVPRAEVEAVMNALFSRVQSVFLSVATETDASGLWPREIRAAVSEYFRDKAVSFRSDVVSDLEKRGISSKGIGGSIS